MCGIEATACTPPRGRPVGVMALVTTRPEIRARLLEEIDTSAFGGAPGGAGVYLWLAEDLGQVASLGPLPSHSYVVNISREVGGPVRERLAGIGKTLDSRRIIDVTFVASNMSLAFARHLGAARGGAGDERGGVDREVRANRDHGGTS